VKVFSHGVKSVLKNSAYLSGATMITSIAKVFYAIALAKVLGPELYGMFNLGMSWYLLFLPISLLGLDSILIREIGRNKDNAAKLIGHSLAIRSISSIFISTLCFLLGYFLETDSTAKSLLFVFSIALLGRGLSLWVNSLLKAFEASFYVFWQETGFRLLELFLGLTILYVGGGVVEVASVHAFSWLMQGVIGFYLVRKNFVSLKPYWDITSIKILIMQGFPFVISAFLANWLFQGGVFVIRTFDGYNQDLGVYALALQVLLILGGILSGLGGAALPALSRSADRGDGKSAYFIDLVLRAGILIGGILAISGLTLGADLIGLIFGPAYLPLVELLPWVLFFVSGYFLMGILNIVIVSFGDYNKVALVSIIGSITFTVLVIPFYKYFGLLGITLATGVGLLSANLMQFFMLKKKYAINLNHSVFRPLIVVFIGFIISYLTLEFSELFSLLLGIFIMILSLFLFKVLRPSEINFMIKLIK
jgi:O-antigen/teichoic acid export membrane protein